MINRCKHNPCCGDQTYCSRPIGLSAELVQSHPSLKRGMVWCRTCGRSEQVNSAVALRHGWPKCHGQTMTIDDPSTWPRAVAAKEG